MLKKLKLSLREVEDFCLKNNILFLDSEYKGVDYKYNFKCLKCDYNWITSFDKIKNQGTRCPSCKGNKQYTIKEAQNKYQKHNLQLLEPDYKNNLIPMKTKCLKCNHIWFFRLSDVGRYGCPNCVGLVSMTLDKVRYWCLKENIIYLDDYYNNTQEKHNFQCKKGHTWNAIFDSIKNKRTRCPNCSLNILTLEEIKTWCLKHKIFYLDDYYNNNREIHNFKCLDCGYVRITPFNHIKNQSFFCPKCISGKVPMVFQEVVDWCLKQNIVFLDKKYEGVLNKYNFQCEKGHVWKTSFSSIKNGGSRCPKCSNRVSNLEIEWLNFLDIQQKYRQEYIKINEKGFKVDAYNPQTNTIYEFLGDYFHGNPIKYKAEDINLKVKKSYGQLYQETMDRIKLFEDNGYKVIYIWESDYKQKYISS